MSSLMLFLGAMTAAGATLFAIAPLRRLLITGPLLQQFRRVMPPMSATERAALEAGNTWWDAELFSGRPRWQRLMEPPAGRLNDAEQAFLDGPVEALCRSLDDWRITHELLDLPPDAWALMRRHRFFGLIIPKEYGGHGFSHRAHSEVVMKLASRSVTGAVTVMVPNSLGPAELLLRYGTERQRAHYLPRLARGDEIPCFALTGPKSGSDAASMPDRGRVCRGRIDGRPTLGVRLDFEKRYITLAPVATLIGIAFQLEDPDGLLSDDPAPGITLALIPANTPGVERGRRHFPLGIPFQNGPVSGQGVFIPMDWIIGGADGVGNGWRMLMETLAGGRGISLPALATGAGKLACRYTGAYAGVRRQFGRAIGDFEGIEEPLARISGRTYQMDAARRLFLSALDAGERPAVLSAILKYHLTELHRQVIDDAMDILGGRGICLGPANPIGRVYQAVPIAITVEGANILTRNLIIFGQGALRCHPSLLDEIAAARDPDPASARRRFDAAVIAHAGQLVRGLSRTLWLGLTRGRGARIDLGSDAPTDPEIARAYRQIQWLSSAFAINADLVLMTLAGSLKRRERLSARLGDLLSLLFLASAVLRQHRDQAQEDPELAAAMRPLLRWALADLTQRIDGAFRALWRNLPSRWLALLLRGLSFPIGSAFRGPDDRLDHAAARILLAPGRARDALTEGIYIGDNDSIGRMDAALASAVAAAPAEQRWKAAIKNGRLDRRAGLRQAVSAGALTAEDADAITRADGLRDQVIQVDAFADLTGTRGEREPERSAA
jgi:acyl-CoA dehydrogenase